MVWCVRDLVIWGENMKARDGQREKSGGLVNLAVRKDVLCF
jgi:hypothetical protein